MRMIEWACMFICQIVLSPLYEELLHKYPNASLYFNRLDNLKLIGFFFKTEMNDPNVFKVVVLAGYCSDVSSMDCLGPSSDEHRIAILITE